MEKVTGIKRIIYIALGWFCVVLGLVGVVVPVLPTTPFLLLAAGLFARSSEKFLRWLLYNKVFGAYIRRYRQGLGIPVKSKVFTLALLWGTILFTAFYCVPILWVQLLLMAVAIGVTIHILKVPTYKDIGTKL